ncbi:MAG: GGDEF domain-containing protein [Actinomycetota bacterium]
MAFDNPSPYSMFARRRVVMLGAVGLVLAASVGAIAVRGAALGNARADREAQHDHAELVAARLRIEISAAAFGDLVDQLARAVLGGSVAGDVDHRAVLADRTAQLQEVAATGRLREPAQVMADETVVVTSDVLASEADIWDMEYVGWVAISSTMYGSASTSEAFLSDASVLSSPTHAVIDTMLVHARTLDTELPPAIAEYVGAADGVLVEADEAWVSLDEHEAGGLESDGWIEGDASAIADTTELGLAGAAGPEERWLTEEVFDLLANPEPTVPYVTEAMRVQGELYADLFAEMDRVIDETDPDGAALWLDAAWMSLAGLAIVGALGLAWLVHRRGRELADSLLLDPMTGVGNRRRLEELEHRWTSGGGPPFGSAIVVDLDRFKMINDSYGHRAGDIVLQTVAANLEQRVAELCAGSEHGHVIRLGGDEFAVVIESLTPRSERTLQEAIHGGRGPVEVDGGNVVEVDFSVGAVTESSPRDLGALLAAADLKAYEHKRSRRLPAPTDRPTQEAAGR